MSYGMADVLQAAVYQTLIADLTLDGIVSGAIYDEVPSGTVPTTYVTLGTEMALDRSDATGDGAEHRFTVSVVSGASGFSLAKQAAAAVSDALHRADLSLSRGQLIFLNFDRAKAKRDTANSLRRIDLSFRARVEDDQL
ncbi:DUF3168 domain-containing protein [Shimia abyssi]|uniref:Uncharacterized protein DUF3168 n=1 Tax=Shimia abyssi TaxID=1662395 RepID=A0A2P8FFT6_9RHOB|nr:DUF3168 domain-containing protein [Shimia abyssi]PSL20577.1 uncharacterized protein DUF3168 [Shimia abyssi]